MMKRVLGSVLAGAALLVCLPVAAELLPGSVYRATVTAPGGIQTSFCYTFADGGVFQVYNPTLRRTVSGTWQSLVPPANTPGTAVGFQASATVLGVPTTYVGLSYTSQGLTQFFPPGNAVLTGVAVSTINGSPVPAYFTAILDSTCLPN